MEHVLNITNDQVYNVLVDQKKIEKQALFSTREEASQQMFLGPPGNKSNPKGVQNGHEPDGTKHFCRGGAETSIPNKRQYNGYFKKDIKAEMAECQNRMK